MPAEGNELPDVVLVTSRMAAQRAGQRFVRRPLGDLQARQPALGVDALGVAPLHRAAGAGGGTETLRALLRAGANVHAADRGGATPLHYAARSGGTEAAKSLLQHGARADVEDKEGATPLLLAIACGFDDMARLLLKARADPCHCTSRASDAEPMLVTVSREGRTEAARMLLLARAKPDQHTPNGGSTPLQLAAAAAHTDLVWELLRAGAQPDFTPSASSSQPAAAAELAKRPLLLAAELGHAVVVQALLNAAADVNCASHGGASAITAAVERGHTEVFHLLLKAGANLDDMQPLRRRAPARRVGRACPQGLKFQLRPDALNRIRGLAPCKHNAAKSNTLDSD